MKFARRAGKRDTLEPEVIEIAKKHGWAVEQLDKWDLQCHRRGWQLSVEVKTGKAPLTGSQQDLIASGWPLYVVRSLEDAEELFA
jgi:hypothetical protein